MTEEIVRRLRHRSRSSLNPLQENAFKDLLLEVEEEDEENKEEEELDKEDTNPDEDMTDEEGNEEEEDMEAPPETPRNYQRSSLPHQEKSADNEEEETEDKPLKIEKDEKQPNVNPLDNQYAVKFKLGDKVSLAYSNGTSTDVNATIEGYDKEGFYRIQLDNGLTINGLTDLSLAELVKSTRESICVCGSKHFVTENNQVVCDNCGRRIRDSLDNLTLLDKKRSEGQKMIRSIPHPMSTAVRPNIADAVSESVEEDEEELDEGPYKKLIDTLGGEFWTRLSELSDDIESLGYDVLEINDDYVTVSNPENDSDVQMSIPLGGTSRTKFLDFKRAKML